MSLDLELLEDCLTTRWLGRKVFYEESVDSTNLWAKALAREGASSGTLCTAERQSAGRGRRGRSWQTPFGGGIAMSLVLCPKLPPRKASMLSLAAGLSVVQGLEALGLSPELKWPNDVVLNKKKVCGILTEMELSGLEIAFVVVGIGVNVNLTEIDRTLAPSATSLRLETGRTFAREQVMGVILNALEERYEQFLEAGDLTPFLKEYQAVLAGLGEEVKIEAGNASFIGTSLGIAPTGELLVRRTEDGRTVHVNAGEVSVRGLYGYV